MIMKIHKIQIDGGNYLNKFFKMGYQSISEFLNKLEKDIKDCFQNFSEGEWKIE